tara:strand:+ start:2615 stop:2839 length:225 start_codon:yes stop_codon:yes gene_type:complete
MSDKTIEINLDSRTVQIDTSTASSSSSVTVELSSANNVEIIKEVIQTANANDVVGLNSFIGNYIDNYTIDCGTP